MTFFFIWDGSKLEFEQYTTYLKSNEYGFTIRDTISSETIDYLDISLTTLDKKII